MNDLDDCELDPFDAELGARLRAVAPGEVDVDGVLAALRPRLARARRRRRAGVFAVGATALALLAGVAFAVTGSAPRSSVDVPPANRSTPAPRPDTRTTVPTSPPTPEPEPAAAATAPAAPPTSATPVAPGSGVSSGSSTDSDDEAGDDHGGSGSGSDDPADDGSHSGSGSSKSGSGGSGDD